MYVCPGCRRAIGLMANAKGQPEMYLCPHSGQPQNPQEHREPRRTPHIPAEKRNEL